MIIFSYGVEVFSLKKLVVSTLILCILIRCSSAVADEILFRGIPWGTSITELKGAISDDFDLYINDEQMMPYWDGIGDQTDSILSLMFSSPSGWNGFDLFFSNQPLVAGYPLNGLRIYCAYGLEDGKVLRDADDSVFYAAQYSFEAQDIQSVYDDLKGKLEALYGVGTETVEEGGGYYASQSGSGEYSTVEKTTIWYGDYNTGVNLSCSISDRDPAEDWTSNFITITYGKADVATMLDDLQSAIKQELLQNEQDNRNDSTDGL